VKLLATFLALPATVECSAVRLLLVLNLLIRRPTLFPLAVFPLAVSLLAVAGRDVAATVLLAGHRVAISATSAEGGRIGGQEAATATLRPPARVSVAVAAKTLLLMDI
jgi:hypothetical protein